MDTPGTPTPPASPARRHRRASGAGWIPAALGVAAAVGLAGCASPPDAASTGADRIQVMASFYPLQYVVEQVGGDRVEVTNLTPPGAEPHDLEISPRQVMELSHADLVVYLSGFQPSVDEAVAEAGPARALDAGSVVAMLPQGAEEAAGGDTAADDAPPSGTTTDTADGEDAAHDTAQKGTSHDAAEQDAAHGTGDGHDHGASGLDPHFWLDPTRMPALVGAVADQLSALDPSHAADYRERAAGLDDALETLDADFVQGLADCRERTFVTSHEAFGYLAHRYDLHQVGMSGIDPEGEPSPARLAEVSRTIRERGVSTVFVEPLVSPRVAQSLASDLGVAVAYLDPLENLTDPSSDYLGIMRTDLSALTTALECR